MNPTLLTGAITNVPHDEAAERTVLSAAILSQDALTEIVSLVTVEDFYMPSNKAIYGAIHDMFDRSMEVAPVALMDVLKTRGELDNVGGPDRILELTGDPFSIASWRSCVDIMQRDSMLREMLYAAVEITALTQQAPEDTREVVDKAESLLLSVTDRRVKSTHAMLREVMDDLYDDLCERTESGDDGGLRTGFPGVDSRTLGLRRGQMVVIGARPGVGKTSLCLNLATNMAYDGVHVALFSLEMSKEEIAQRLLATRSGVSLSSIRSASMGQAEWQSIVDAIAELRDLPIAIDDTPGTTATEIRAKARRMLHGVDRGVVIVDYIQLMSSPSKQESRATAVGEMSRGMKIMAKELGVPVIALSQLNREVEGRQGKRPQLSDLRESGSIEQDADIVMLLDRSMTPEEAERKDRPAEGVTALIIAKNRSGPLGTVNLRFDGDTTRFIELEENGRYLNGPTP
jgi:replicative DNA helicase